jgi:prolyl-tRNA synthetase
MRLSELFTRTLRDAPADAELVSHQLIVRAGLARPVAAGIYALMPLGWRVIRKIEAILRAEMDAINGQELHLPVVQPAEVFQASGRWEAFGPVLQKFSSESGRDYALGPTHEDVLSVIAAREIDSYRQLPQYVYQIQTKYRNEPRPRGGLVRLREFIMKDAYSFHTDADDLGRFYARMYAAYQRIFTRVGVEAVAVEADTGAMGGQASHEFVIRHPWGEGTIATCDSCGYVANSEVARFVLPAPTAADLLPVQKVATPNCKTIQEVADFLGVPTTQTLKAVFFVRERPTLPGEFVFAVIRGDLEINEVKLINALGGGELRPATDDEIRTAGAVPGYASPLGLQGITIMADQSVRCGANFVAGANDEGYHLTGVNVPRDFDPPLADIADAVEGAICGRCEAGHLHIERVIELGHCFKLGTRYSEAVGVLYQDEQGSEHPVVMGSYGIGLERLMAAIIEAHHDDYGIIWPACVAPYDVHIVVLGKEPEVPAAAQQVYADLRAAGFEVLLDDRSESAGVKFADADLIGLPVRLTISKKAFERGGVEVKRRDQPERAVVPLGELIAWVGQQLR